MWKFDPLDHYTEWVMNTTSSLESRGLGRCIVDGNTATEGEKKKAIKIMRYYLTEDLRKLCKNIEDPCELWERLKTRNSIMQLRKGISDWNNLKFHDFESVDEYNSALMKIAHSLELCGEVVTEEDLLYKTHSTFHQQDKWISYIAKRFNTYNELLTYLLKEELRKKQIKEAISKHDKVMKRYYEYRNSEIRLPEKAEEPKEPTWENVDCEAGLYLD